MIHTRDLKVTLFWGRKGSGKSLIQGVLLLELFGEYYATETKFPSIPKRTLYSNQPFSKAVEQAELGKHLEYWSSPRQLYHLRNCDILWDEIQKDLPTGAWQDTPSELKKVFSHLRKRGNRLFCNAQVYEDLDIAVRRQVDFAWHVTKKFGSGDVSASLPPPKRVWGLIELKSFDPLDLEVEKKNRKPNKVFSKYVLMRRRYVEMFDTSAELPPYMPDSLEHFEFKCINPKCDKVHIEHKKIYK